MGSTNFNADLADVIPRDQTYGNEYQHNISIQTGEEFSPQFLRDRAATRRTPFVNEADWHTKNKQDPDVVQNHHHIAFEDSAVHLGVRREDSEGGLELSNSKDSSLPYSKGPHFPDGSRSGKMKFLCSFGGKILPRPNDGKLRYVGGETRIISIRNNLTYIELVRKTSVICKPPHMIKYQLPDEDLDALISVSTDEDLYLMIEEYHELEKISQRLRIFLVSSSDSEGGSCSSELKTTQENDGDSQYVDAVNGMSESSHHRSSSRESLVSQRGGINFDGNTTIFRNSPSSLHRSDKQSEGSSLNLKLMLSSSSSQVLNASPYIPSPPFSPMRFRDPMNSYIKRCEDGSYREGYECAQTNVVDVPTFENPLCADVTGYCYSHPIDTVVIGSPIMGSHFRRPSKDLENFSSNDPSNFNVSKGWQNSVPQYEMVPKVSLKEGTERVRLTRLAEKSPSLLVSSVSQERVAQQKQTADKNFHIFTSKDPLFQNNQNIDEDYIEWGMDAIKSIENKDASCDDSQTEKHDFSTNNALSTKFVDHKWNLPKIICSPEVNRGYPLLVSQVTGVENQASSCSSSENPLEIHSQSLENHDNNATPEIPVIVEHVTDRAPPDIPCSSLAIPHIQHEPSDMIESPGEETEAETVIPESDYDDVSADEDDKDESISDAAIIEMEAGKYGLQIIKNADLEDLKELGSGTYGTVYHGKWRGTDVAIKRIKKSCFAGRSSEQERLTKDFWREAQIISKLHHPNVVAFYGVVPDGPETTLATVAEYMANGSLRCVLLKKDRALDHRKKVIIALDAAFGMEYLHLKNIVHFDLKCDNLLVNLGDPHRPICKVGDFGLSRIKQNTLVSGGVRGTLPWMAPELLNGNSS